MWEAMDRIKAAEKEAVEMKFNAMEKASEAVTRAKEEGRQYVEYTVADAKKAAEKMVKQAEKDVLKAAGSKVKSAADEAEKLMKHSEEKLEHAAHKVVEEITDRI